MNTYTAGFTCWDNGPPEFVYLRDAATNTDQVDIDGDGKAEVVRTREDEVAFRSALLPGLASTWTIVDMEAASPLKSTFVLGTGPGRQAPAMFGFASPVTTLETVQGLEDKGERSPAQGQDVGVGPGTLSWTASSGVVESVILRPPAGADTDSPVESIRVDRIEGALDPTETTPSVAVGSQPVLPFLVTSTFADNSCGGTVAAEPYLACVRDIASDKTVDEWLALHHDDPFGEIACHSY